MGELTRTRLAGCQDHGPAIVTGTDPDAFQDLLAEVYQRLQDRPKVHTHKCCACEAELTCSCNDRRQVDRLTGKERRLYCVGCGMVRDALTRAEAQVDAT